jgi:hypothetical protein
VLNELSSDFITNSRATRNSRQRLNRSTSKLNAFFVSLFTGGKTPLVHYRFTKSGKKQLAIEPRMSAFVQLHRQITVLKQRFKPLERQLYLPPHPV